MRTPSTDLKSVSSGHKDLDLLPDEEKPVSVMLANLHCDNMLKHKCFKGDRLCYLAVIFPDFIYPCERGTSVGADFDLFSLQDLLYAQISTQKY